MKIKRTLLSILVMMLLITTVLVPCTETQAKAKVGTTKVTVKNNDIGTDLKISWKKVSKANGYAVYMATSKNGKYKKVITTDTNSYLTSGLKKNKNYYFKVKAYTTVNGKNSYGSYSKVASCKTSKYPLNTVIDGGGDNVYFYWLWDGKTAMKDKNYWACYNKCIATIESRHTGEKSKAYNAGAEEYNYYINSKQVMKATPHVFY